MDFMAHPGGHSSIPDSLSPFCHSPLLSPHCDRGERQGITSPRFYLFQLWFFPHRMGHSTLPSRSQPDILSCLSFSVFPLRLTPEQSISRAASPVWESRLSPFVLGVSLHECRFGDRYITQLKWTPFLLPITSCLVSFLFL